MQETSVADARSRGDATAALSNDALATIVDAIDEAVIAHSLDGQILTWSAGAQRMRVQHPRTPLSLMFGDFGHQRAAILVKGNCSVKARDSPGACMGRRNTTQSCEYYAKENEQAATDRHVFAPESHASSFARKNGDEITKWTLRDSVPPW